MKKKIGIYYDCETTGTNPRKDRIIELAAYAPDGEKSFCTFIDPKMAIPAEITKITGINDEMVQGAPTIEEALKKFIDFCGEDAILIAHNNDAFDKIFLEEEAKRSALSLPSWGFIDTLKWSRKYRSDLPKHALQYLREVYQIPANNAHRALDDCIVLHQVFQQMIDDLSFEQAQKLLSETAKLVRMPFGKHGGKPLSEIPKDYVTWLSSSGAFDKPENLALKEQFQQLGLLV